MIIEKVIGNLKRDAEMFPINQKRMDAVVLDWFECDKKILRKQTTSGMEIGIRLKGDGHLHDQDVLYEDDEKIIVVEVRPVKAITFYSDDVNEMVQFAYLIGNRHAPLFYENQKLAIPFDKPMEAMLEDKSFAIEVEQVCLMHLMEGHTHHEH